MKETELRVGNYVLDSYNGKITRVNWQEIKWIQELTDRYIPIELTEEILLKSGFELKGIIFRINNGFTNQFDVNYSLSRNIYYYDSSKYGIYNEVELKYLHQLQNLYFALTGEELKIQL